MDQPLDVMMPLMTYVQKINQRNVGVSELSAADLARSPLRSRSPHFPPAPLICSAAR